MKIQLDLSKTPFNLEHTLKCGQAFRWEKLGDWYGVIYETVVKARQTGNLLVFKTFPEKLSADFSRYFRLDDDLPHIFSKIEKDECVREAIQKFYGLRITRQEPWECLISYMCATNANIPAIKRMISNMSIRFGRKVVFEGREFFTFPKPSDLANSSVEELRQCKLGFRSEHVLETSRIINQGKLNLEDLRRMNYREAKQVLTELPSVGPKVADCVLLFSLDKLEAFPVDIWMKRIVLEHYSSFFERSFVDKVLSKRSLSRLEYETISSFGRTYFGEYVGYAQEYLYHFRRCQSQR